MNEVAKKMLTKSKNSRLEKFGKTITFLCMSLIVVVVAMILIFVAQKGLSTFFVICALQSLQKRSPENKSAFEELL